MLFILWTWETWDIVNIVYNDVNILTNLSVPVYSYNVDKLYTIIMN